MMRLLKFALTSFVSVVAVSCGQSVKDTSNNEKSDIFISELQKDYPVTFSKIAENVWVHTSNYQLPGQTPIPVNGLIIVDGDEVILADAAWGELATVSLLEKVKSEFGKPITKLITTHHHADRTMGVDAAEREGIEVFTHPDTPALAARNGWPVPNTSVAALKEPKSRIKVGNIEVAYPGHGHAQDNIVVYVPSSQVLYVACLARGAESTNLGNTMDADLKKWAESLAWTKATYAEAQTVVPGHGKGSDLRLIDKTLQMIATEVNAQNAAENADTP